VVNFSFSYIGFALISLFFSGYGCSSLQGQPIVI
jgi:hypothetical protein